MAVSSLSSATVNASSAQQQSASKNSSGSSQNNPLAVLQNKISSTNTQLSAFGKVKVSLDDLQARAKALSSFEKSPNLNDLKVAVSGFVQAFNTVHTVVTKETQKQGALAQDARSARALSEVSRSASGQNNQDSRTALEKIGITRDKNGTLAVDEKKLEAAFQTDQAGTLKTLAGLGQRVDQATGRQLTGSSGVGTKVNDLTSRVNDLDKLNKDLQQRLDTQKQALQSQAAQLASLAPSTGHSTSNAAASAVASYVGVSTL